MRTKSWYTNADRTPVVWATAVVSGVAKTDIYEVKVEDTHQNRLVWAKNGQAVSDEKLAKAKADGEAGSVPADTKVASGRGRGRAASQKDVTALTARVVVLEAKP